MTRMSVLKLISVIQIFMICHSSPFICPEKEIFFDCDLKVTDSTSHLLCFGTHGEDSPDGLSNSESPSLFVISTTQKRKQQETGLSLLYILDSPYFLEKADFYSCKNDIRRFGLQDFKSFCDDKHDCLQYVSKMASDTNVESLTVSNWPIVTLNRTTFSNFPNLFELNIESNNHVSVSENAFGVYTFLHELSLTNNSVLTLHKDAFQSMNYLQNLDLSSNDFLKITPLLFSGISQLTKLNISRILLTELEEDTFQSNFDLKVINMSFNIMQDLPNDVFKNCTRLSVIDLSGNNFVTLKFHWFSGLTNLRKLIASDCKFHEIQENIFQDVIGLIHLDLSHNNLENLPKGLLTKQSNLEHLDISQNNIVEFLGVHLDGKLNLKTLNLSNNRISSLSDKLFSDTKDLQYLDINKNRITFLDVKHVETFRNLYFLNASNNYIEKLEMYPFININIRRFDLSKNRIRYIKIAWHKFLFLEEIRFDFNYLSEIKLPPCDVNAKLYLIFSFRNNSISNVAVPFFSNVTENSGCFLNGSPRVSVFMGNNPLNCNCRIFDFYSHLSSHVFLPHRFYLFPDSTELRCDHPTDLQGKVLSVLPKNALKCPVNRDCPELCTCYIRGYDQRIVLNCSFSGSQIVPKTLPKNTTVLYLIGNNIDNVNVTQGNGWQNVTELYLDNNTLVSIESQLPESLQFLSLTNNQIQDLSLSLKTFASSQKNFKMNISNNRWYCDCRSMQLITWILENQDKIEDIENLICPMKNNGSRYSLPLYKIPNDYLCLKKQSYPNTIMIIVVLCSLSVILILSLSLFYHRNRTIILAFLYDSAMFRGCFQNEGTHDDKYFDAFIAYSSVDRSIVLEMINELENSEPHFKLCIHERDWIPGYYIGENIVNSVQSSKRVLVIMSEDFVSSVWFNVEIRAALFHTHEDHTKRLVIIVVDKFPSLDCLDDGVKKILLKKTYITWGERWFWRKLRYAMPHKTQTVRSAIAVRERFPEMVTLVERDVEEAIILSSENCETLSNKIVGT